MWAEDKNVVATQHLFIMTYSVSSLQIFMPWSFIIPEPQILLPLNIGSALSQVWTLRPQPWEEKLALLAILCERFRSASKKTRQVDMVAFRVIHWLLSAVIVLKCQAGPLAVKHEHTNSTSSRSNFEAFVGSFLCSFD